jgi:hypothetical protein
MWNNGNPAGNRLEIRSGLSHIGPERMIGLPIINGRVHEPECASGNRFLVSRVRRRTVSASLFT